MQLDNKTMNKGDIKATIILLIYISVGVLGSYFLNKHNPTKDGKSYFLGFILGITLLALLQCVWNLIRLSIEDLTLKQRR